MQSPESQDPLPLSSKKQPWRPQILPDHPLGTENTASSPVASRNPPPSGLWWPAPPSSAGHTLSLQLLTIISEISSATANNNEIKEDSNQKSLSLFYTDERRRICRKHTIDGGGGGGGGADAEKGEELEQSHRHFHVNFWRSSLSEHVKKKVVASSHNCHLGGYASTPHFLF